MTPPADCVPKEYSENPGNETPGIAWPEAGKRHKDLSKKEFGNQFGSFLFPDGTNG